MELNILKPRKALNKAYLRVKPNRVEIENFKKNLSLLLDSIDDNESEEFHKNLVSDFLKDTYYKHSHFVNTKGRNDLVIHNAEKSSSTVGVIIETKKPTNKAEMLSKEKINVKAFHELVLYYLRERITQKNVEIKYVIATSINEWFIFDATIFDRLFAQNKALVKQFIEFERGALADTKTDFFYKQIVEPFVSEISHQIDFTYFDIRDYEKILRNADKKDDKHLIILFKIFSPEHLLKLPFANDSNSLDKRFYEELLHIIGLTETKEKNRKVIKQNKKGERNTGALLENAIIQLDSLDKISRLENPTQFGKNQEDRLFNVSLELSITWVNRILFLKLLEAQLLAYHKGDKSYEFLNTNKIKDYDDLNSLFFQVLARRQDERNEDLNPIFSKIPYLNSSLFEPTEIEHATLFISQLRNDKTIPLYSQTILKDNKGRKQSGEINPLEYLFKFLSAYDFTSEGSEEIQEDNKTLINASVLGLIFEKINGYKDGSFFTPGYITMYMCRDTIRKAVIQKFNDIKGWNCESINSLYDKIDDKVEANNIINDLKICDPAVGSGHFLVSALNEIISIKNDLKILSDRQGRRLKEYQLEVVNDELIVTDEDGEFFEYFPGNKESQRIQETLFHEKQNIIENCLFGVDINPNSVKICRLRLWIELLKNAYYKNETELETLPNIDINIKCGNSLVSRFDLDSDIKLALKKTESKWTVSNYRNAVDTYRNAQNKEQKKSMEKLINEIKTNFRSEISANDPKIKRLRNITGELYSLNNQQQLFELSKKEKVAQTKKAQKLSSDVKKLEAEIAEIKNNKIFEDAFEWRFEFPEVLDNNGSFTGFDVIIGNPPYGVKLEEQELQHLKTNLFNSSETAILFIHRGRELLNKNGKQSYIIPKAFTFASNYSSIREALLNELTLVADCHKPWQEVKLEACIFQIEKNRDLPTYFSMTSEGEEFLKLSETSKDLITDFGFILNGVSENEIRLANKIRDKSIFLGEVATNKRGVGIQKDLLSQGKFSVLGGIDIERDSIRDTQRGFLNDISEIEEIGKISPNSVLAQNIVAHLTNPVGHIKIIATMPPEPADRYIILDTINQFTFMPEVSNVFGCFFLNSKLINWYVYNFIYAKAIRTMHFDNVVTNRIPFPKAFFEIESLPEKLSDTLLYEMFELTNEEISIIESTFKE